MIDGKSFKFSSNQPDAHQANSPDVKLSSNTTEKPQIDYDFSERGKADASLKNTVLSHYIETHQATQNALESMGFLDDIGVKQDGLVHISKLKKQRIKHPLEVVALGDIVTVWVEQVEVKKGRISLTMLPPQLQTI